MTDMTSALEGFTLKDLISDGGITFKLEPDVAAEEEEPFSYSSDVHLTNMEMLKCLNMDLEDDVEEGPKEDAFTPLSISFEKYKAKMTNVTGDGKVMKMVKQKGVGGVIPHDSQVTIHYVGYCEHLDDPFDSSFARRKPDVLRLGQGQLIPGLEIGISTMEKHEIAVFIIHPDLAYRTYGCLPRIPPNTEVMFAVQLVDFLDNGSADTYENLSVEDKRTFSKIEKWIVDMLKTAGDNFRKYKVRQAIRDYKRVVFLLDTAQLKNEEEEQRMKALLSKACTNLAVCYNKEDMPRQACVACNKAPIPTAKTYFNHGRALFKMGEYARSMEELQKAHKREPHNKETITEIQQVSEKQRQYLGVEKRLWKNCFKGLNMPEGVDTTNEFSEIAKEMCEAFARDNALLRQPLPEGLTPTEEKYFREHAAVLGLNVTTHTRYGKEVVYLSKPQY